MSQGRRPFGRRRKSCPFSGANAPVIDYKDTRLLQRYVSERAKLYRAALPLFLQKNSANWPVPLSAHAISR